MAHEIETHGDAAAAVFAREDAWHALGTTLPDAFTAEEAMTIGHLGGWDVRKAPVTALTDSGMIEVPDQYATIRTNPFTGAPEALGIVGKGYTPIQNEAHCEFLNSLVDESGAIFDTAGSLRGGREVFITMRMPEHIMVGGIDPIGLYLAALNSHDGTRAFKLLVTPVRIVCANTQRAALANSRQSWSIRHTVNASKNIQAAREGLGLTFAYVDEFAEEAERMINAKMTEGRFMDIIRKEFGAPEDASARIQKNAQAEMDMFAELWNSTTQDEIRGTRWAAYQVMTEYVDHRITVRTRPGEDETMVRAERNLVDPTLAGIKQWAWEKFAPKAAKAAAAA